MVTIEGKVPGKGRRGRRRMNWMNNIIYYYGTDREAPGGYIHGRARNREMPTVRAWTMANS